MPMIAAGRTDAVSLFWSAAMDFPLSMLMDEQACYDKLVEVLHPQGLACPRCRASKLGVHRRCRAPVLDYQCGDCGRVFNAFTGSALAGTPRSPTQVMLILRGFAQGVSTAQLARELKAGRGHRLDLRHQCQASVLAAAGHAKPLPPDSPVPPVPDPRPDAVTEADEMYQNAGEKRRPARRSRRVAAPTRSADTAPGTTSARRCSAWSGVRAARCGWR
jgi:transposase-like protein